MQANPTVLSLDVSARADIERKFGIKRELASAKEEELFGVFREALTAEETWALKFLFAYMPLGDLADYDGALFLRHVRQTLDIRARMPWGSRVPDALFMHYVLPYRVNNENIDESRGLLFGELESRVKHLSMEDAILETNHWCYEKATYVGTDPRTVSPLTLMRAALGRCGEQSTLAVSALRSLCIPARQVYTPRWAHCDSNHAWVEAWADGNWRYLGACEPEPRLDRGWFGGPARRAMLVHARLPSNDPGSEDVTLAHEWYTELNLLDGYAKSRTIRVRAVDSGGRPVQAASVLLQVYNIAEFSPIAQLSTNEQGEVSLKTGYGDLYVHASRDGRWGEMKISVPTGDAFELVLDRTEQTDGSIDLDMVPPPEMPEDASQAVTDEEKLRHNERVQAGARIRQNFESSFVGRDAAAVADLAEELQLPAERVREALLKAKGNGGEIAAFLRECSGEHGEWPLRLLESLNGKDLTDTFRPALRDHLTGALPYAECFDEETFVRYILCPRVLYEMIGPYKLAFQAAIPAEEREQYRLHPAAWAARIAAEFEVVEGMTYYQGAATPLGSFRLRKGDRASRDILFVASCRSFGIPARLHPELRKPQYWVDGAWREAAFEPEAASGSADREPAAGSVLLLRDPEAKEETPEAAYGINFTFALLDNGVYRTLSYPHGKTDVYGEPFTLETGAYRLTAGTRLQDGTALVRLTHFTVAPGARLQLPLTFRQRLADVPVLGEADRGWAFASADGASATLGELLAERPGAVLAWLEPEREPSKHLLRELGELASGLERLGVACLFAIGDADWPPGFDSGSDAYRSLPDGTRFVRDDAGAPLRDAASRTGTAGGGLPLVLVLDGECRIRYMSSGYKLGVGQEALRTLTRLAR